MNANQITVAYRTWKLLNRKWNVSPARIRKAIGKAVPLQVVKMVEDCFHVEIEKTESGYHMKGTGAKQRVARKPKAKKASKARAKKKAAPASPAAPVGVH